MYDHLDKKFFGIVQKYEYDVKVSRTRTFVRGQRRTKVRPCGHTFRNADVITTVIRSVNGPVAKQYSTVKKYVVMIPINVLRSYKFTTLI